MEAFIRKAVKEVLAQKASCDFCSCSAGDVDEIFPLEIQTLEDELVNKISEKLVFSKEEIEILKLAAQLYLDDVEFSSDEAAARALVEKLKTLS